jgi:hypothetical protein
LTPYFLEPNMKLPKLRLAYCLLPLIALAQPATAITNSRSLPSGSTNSRLISKPNHRSIASAQVTNTPFQVCLERNAWVRPSLSEQKNHLASNGRYSSISAEGDDHWKYKVFALTTYPGGSGTYDLGNVSGLWKENKGEKIIRSAKCDGYIPKLNAGELASIWLLNYKIVNLTWNGDRYVMRVKNVRKGTQTIHFDRKEKLQSLPLSVIDENGHNVSVLF